MEQKSIKEKLHNHIKPLGTGDLYFLYYKIYGLSEVSTTAFLNDIYNHFTIFVKKYDCTCKKSNLLKPQKNEIGFAVKVEGAPEKINKLAYAIADILQQNSIENFSNA